VSLTSRWLAVTLGCVTALGIQTLLGDLAPRVGVSGTPGAAYGGMFLALVLAGFVTGHLVGRWHAFNGALAAVAYIFVVATITAVREVNVVRETGVLALTPIDYPQLALSDFVALTGASVGGWLAGMRAPAAERP
jgi:hypothetical protein